MYNNEYQEDIAQPTKQPDKASSMRYTFTINPQLFSFYKEMTSAKQKSD